MLQTKFLKLDSRNLKFYDTDEKVYIRQCGIKIKIIETNKI